MAIKKFENKALKVGGRVTEKRKNAIIETKHKFCYPQYGRTVMAGSKEEADKIIKKTIK